MIAEDPRDQAVRSGGGRRRPRRIRPGLGSCTFLPAKAQRDESRAGFSSWFRRRVSLLRGASSGSPFEFAHKGDAVSLDPCRVCERAGSDALQRAFRGTRIHRGVGPAQRSSGRDVTGAKVNEMDTRVPVEVPLRIPPVAAHASRLRVPSANHDADSAASQFRSPRRFPWCR